MRELHDLEPAIRAGLLPRDQIANALDEDLTAATWDGVEPRRLELANDVARIHAECLGEEIDLRWTEAVNVERMVCFDVAEQLGGRVERDMRIVPPLREDLHCTGLLRLMDLPSDVLVRQR